MNSYLIIGNDFEAVKIEEDKIINQEKWNDSETTIYDLEETSIENALEDLDTYHFLSNKKTIIIRNINTIKESDFKDELNHLIKYIENPSQDNLLIIEINPDKKDTKESNIEKELKKKCRLIEVEINSKSYIKELLKEYTISQNAINLLDEYCGQDITKIKTECDKLKSYSMDTKKIEENDIKELVQKKLIDPKDLTFSFTRNIGERNINKALKDYKELLEYNIEPIQIIGLLSSQLRILYQVKLLSSKSMTDREIANMLEEKEFRIKKTRELISLYTEKDILNLIQQLSDMDLRMKTTETNSKNELELFILNIENSE